ncbi:hypothetical protein K7432_014228 [Basidiobolus ranarum]|uniref:AMP-dependent synthetase/ligase domain-containing protein n=1 Tax=Basidiobolus ranarum TaxID=34480 RepID=A0ABR2VPR7_9FUNG
MSAECFSKIFEEEMSTVMNSLNAGVCQFPCLLNGEGAKNEGANTFHVKKFDILSMDLPDANSPLKALIGLEKTLLYGAWAIMLNLYTRNTDISFGVLDSSKQCSQWTVEDFEVFQSVYDQKTECMIVSDWLKLLAGYPETRNTTDLSYSKDLHTFNTCVILREQETSLDLIGLEFAICLEAWFGRDGLDIQLTFSSSHLQQDQGLLFTEQLVHIVQTLVQNLGTTLEQLNWTPECEKELFLDAWQQGKDDLIGELDECCIHTLVEKQVKSTPDNVALQFEDKELITYAELNRRANRLAHCIIQLGVMPDELVPLCIEKSIDMVVAILAVLKAGAAYVPLDAEYPQERISFILRDTNAGICITTSSLSGIFSEYPNIQLVMADQSDFIRGEIYETNPIVPHLKSSNLCYLIFTSGSTGKPKGVMLEHRNVINYITAHKKLLNLTQNDRFLQFSNYTFDASILDIFVNLTIGSRICLASKNNLLTNLAQTARLMEVTAAQLTTTVAGLLDPTKVPTLKLLQQGGEMLTKAVRDTWSGRVILHNGYGPTETTVYTVVRESLSQSTSCTNIGRPIGRNKVFILSNQLKLIPLGAISQKKLL